MSVIKNKKVKYLIFFLFFIIGLAYLFFNEAGAIKYLKLKSQLKDLNEQISTVEKDNKRIQAEIDSLQKKIPAKIERTAREKYGMIRKGEKTIKIIEK
jgi:cell division protein FtsB